ncbi:MAG: tight adherence protein B [Bermanella sp.]|jgi:tight adherence protein B
MDSVIQFGLLGATLLFLFVAVAAVATASANTVNESLKLYQSQFTENAEVALRDVFIFANAQVLFFLNIVALLVVPILLHLNFGVLIVTAGSFVILLVLPRIVYTGLRTKRLKSIEDQLPDAFIMLSNSLQAGASLNMALEDLVRQSPAPLNQEFGLLVRRIRLGSTLDEALVELEQRIPISSFIMASSAMRISREVGGNLVETINAMADTLRKKKAMEGKIQSLTAQGRAQGIFMSVLPLLMGVALSFLEPEAMSQLIETNSGMVVLSIMITMQVLGFMFIRKITNIDA